MFLRKLLCSLCCALSVFLLISCSQPERIEAPSEKAVEQQAADEKVTVPYKEFLAANPKLYSQKNEEVIIRHFFGDKRAGFFVDLGCSKPIFASTTYYLENHLGWTGIGIDALADFKPAMG